MIKQSGDNEDKVMNGVKDGTVEEKDGGINDVNSVVNKGKNDINGFRDDSEVENSKNK
ncbi:DUF1542 domain-containing protein, partial [Staphylococcus warneri]|uniref:DUF1542 domain-containing protein n=1 Tax=Staphylococcus warneri TaxID=1292 RepID=UPI0011A502F0